MSAPSTLGFYWAKWRIADDGSSTDENSLPCDTWEVVELYENSPTDLKVFVGGESKGQSPENFFWGPGPLRPPESPAISRLSQLTKFIR